MFLWIKGIWEELIRALKVSDWGLLPARELPWLRTGYALALQWKGRSAGYCGLLQPAIGRAWRILEPLGLLEVSVAPLLAESPRSLAPLAAYPAIARDAALVADEAVKHDDILNVVRRLALPELERVELFDIFRGPAIGSGRKSMAYSFVYRSGERTLTDEEANRFHDAIKQQLKKELEVEVREG
jgi:phenylalanyl-tRNA synthetase beta chain